MIERLESAGLGFFVKASETQQKLGILNFMMHGVLSCVMYTLIGKIPLRQLVYRVLDLPPSMRPLVYDFGQLNEKTEREYIKQIVQNQVNTFVIVRYIDPSNNTWMLL